MPPGLILGMRRFAYFAGNMDIMQREAALKDATRRCQREKKIAFEDVRSSQTRIKAGLHHKRTTKR